eukprot:GEMP01006445.1.p1 GENE.GEMP01006445.1~~GEMP01006445.1.p1  ORF type:complete len:1033 (+),score=242.21 GEMP01006445.1:44-3142(+)
MPRKEETKFRLPSLLKMMSLRTLDAQAEAEHRRILQEFSRPYHLVSLPNLHDTSKRVRIADLDKFLAKKGKLAPLSLQEFTQFYESGDQDAKEFFVPTPKARPIPLSPTRPALWNLEHALQPDEVQLMPQRTPKLEGTFLDALETYKRRLAGYSLTPEDPVLIFGEILEITFCELCGPHCRAISDALAVGPMVKKFIIRQNKICDTGVALLVTAAFKHPIEVFELDDAPLGKYTMKAFAKTNTSMLMKFTVTNAGIGDVLGTWEEDEPDNAENDESHQDTADDIDAADADSGAQPNPRPAVFGDMAALSSRLPSRNLISSSTNTSDAGSRAPLNTSLDMGHFFWDPTKTSTAPKEEEVTGLIGKPIFDIILSSRILNALDLSSNTFSSEAWRELNMSLTLCTELETLTLDQCHLKDDSVSGLSGAIREMKKLQTLSLRTQHITADTKWLVLMRALEDHPRLAHLDVTENDSLPPSALAGVLRNALCVACVHFDWNPDLAQTQEMAAEMGWSHSDYGRVVAWRALHVKDMCAWQLAPGKSPEDHVFIEGCWICQKCVGLDIAWSIPESGPLVLSCVNLVPSWTRWRPISLPRAKVTSRSMSFSKAVMIPPGKENYFFFQGPAGLMYAANLPSVPTDSAVKEMFADRDVLVPARINYVEPPEFTIPSETVEGKEALKKIGATLMLKPGDGVNSSEFKTRNKILKQCLAEDIKAIDFSLLCKEAEENSLRRRMWSRYTTLYDLYMVYQGRGALHVKKESSLNMRMNDLWDFIEELRQAQSANSRFAHVDYGQLVALVATGTVTRPAFWEFLIRLSVQVYPDRGVTDAFSAFVDHCVPSVLAMPLAPFHRDYMGHADVQAKFFDWRETIKSAYSMFATSPLKFVTLTQTVRLYEKSFTAKHSASVFALSKQPAPLARTHQKLTPSEFQEAFARLVLVKMHTGQNDKRVSQQLPLQQSTQKSWRRRGVPQETIRGPLYGTTLKGADLFREVVRILVARNVTEILAARTRAFASRLESLIRLLDEKLKVETIRQEGVS